MNDSSSLYGKILVAICFRRSDGSDEFDDLLKQAARFSVAVDAELHVICVHEPPSALEAQTVGETPQIVFDEYFDEIELRARLTAEASGVQLSSIEVVDGSPASTILRYVTETGCELVILSRRGQGLLHRWRLSSTIYRLLERCACPLVVFPSHALVSEAVGYSPK